jgi:hypothetical protein
MTSVDTFDTWLRAGFIPGPHIDREQIVRWHWPSLEESLLQKLAEEKLSPSTHGFENIPKPKPRRCRAQ